MKVEILSREVIKPYTATPPSFRNYKISLLDELSPNVNLPIIFYYLPSGEDSTSTSRNSHLKKSLSKALAAFHPFAGRYHADSHSVHCSDQGAEFMDAKVDIGLDDLLSQRKDLKMEVLNDLLPCPLGAVDEFNDPLLAVQVSAFSCGGLAIAVCVSHRIADMSTIISFIKEWAMSAKQELGHIDENHVPMAFNLDSAVLLPGKMLPGLPSGLSPDKENIQVHKSVTKMFYFNKKRISSIRERARFDESSMMPTRVQCIFGITGKAMIDVHVANPKNPKGYTLLQAVNIRKRTVPPLPDNQFGNLYIYACVQSEVGSQGVVGLPGFVDCLSKSVKGVADTCVSHGKEGLMTITHRNLELIKSFGDLNMYFVGLRAFSSGLPSSTPKTY